MFVDTGDSLKVSLDLTYESEDMSFKVSWNRNQCWQNTRDWFKNQRRRSATYRSYSYIKSLKAQLDVVHKTVSEVEAQLYTYTCSAGEIEDIIIKNNKGTEDKRVRKLDYSIQLSKLFYEKDYARTKILVSSLIRCWSVRCIWYR